MPGSIKDYERKMSHSVVYINLRKHWEPQPLDLMVTDDQLMFEVADSAYLCIPTPEVGERLIAVIREGVEELRRRKLRQQPEDVTP